MPTPRLYTFDEYRLDLENRALYRGTELLRLAPKVFDTLLYLVEHPGQIIGKQELLAAVWRGSVVEAGGLVRNVSILRTVLNDEDGLRYIETMPKRGYRFNANVHGLTSIRNEVKSPDIKNSVTQPQMTAQLTPATKLHRKFIGHPSLQTALLAIALATAFVVPQQFNQTDYTMRQLTSNSAELPIIAAALSPDGKMLAYTEVANIVVTKMGSTDKRSLPAPANTIPGNLEWFPDEKHVLVSGFNPHTHQSLIWSVSVSGGESTVLNDNASMATLSPKGDRIAFIRDSTQIWIANSDGGNEKLFATAAKYTRFGLHPQFSADGHYIVVGRIDSGNFHTILEAHRIDNGNTVSLYMTDNYISDFRLLFTNELLISVLPERRELGSNIMSTRVDLNAGTHAPLHSIAAWPKGISHHFSASNDGHRISVINDLAQSDVYVADIQADDSALANVQRLTMDDSSDRPAGWLRDNHSILFYSNRHGSYGIYRQETGHFNAEAIVNDSRDNTWPVVTPDQRWLLYFSGNANEYGANVNMSLMRKQMAGGPAELIDTKPDLYRSLRCADAAGWCVIAEHSATESIFYQFDPVQGRGRELARAPWIPGSLYDWDIAPDGSRIAFIDAVNGPDTVAIVSLGNNSTAHLHIAGYEQLRTLAWDAAGKGFYISTHDSDRNVTPMQLLHVAQDGKVNVLRFQVNSDEGWAMPSPDGQHLAFQRWSQEGNVWLLQR